MAALFGHASKEQVEVCRLECLQAFLSANQLKLIIRSHEGPDARARRPACHALPSVDSGFALDHDTPSEFRAFCSTAFSADERRAYWLLQHMKCHCQRVS